MADFVKVAQVSDLPDPGKRLVEVDDRLVVLFHLGGEFFCLDDVCTHDGGPLGEGCWTVTRSPALGTAPSSTSAPARL